MLQRAAAGALAMLTAAQKKLAVKITKVVCIINKLQQLSNPYDSFVTFIYHFTKYCGSTMVHMVQCCYQILIPKMIDSAIMFYHLQTGQWLEIIQRLCIHENPEILHRGLVMVYNMLDADEQLAKKLIECELLEILTYVAKLEDNPKKQDAINTARACLTRAMDSGFIKPFSN